MKILSLLPPRLKEEDRVHWVAKIHNAAPVLKLLDGYISKQLIEINKALDCPKKYDKPGYDRYISGLLASRAELQKIREFLTLDKEATNERY